MTTQHTTEPREWTDERDDAAYAIYARMADAHDETTAAEYMRDLRTEFNLPFVQLDLDAWAARYADER